MPTAYITAPPADAEDLANGIIDRNLAACVNRVACSSTYRWEGEVVSEDEVILLAKTTANRYAELVEYVEATHPHDVPCIEQFEESEVLPAFAQWRRDVTAPTDNTES